MSTIIPLAMALTTTGGLRILLMMEFNLSNRITLLRIAVIPLLMTFILIPPAWGKIVAILIFALAALSDAVDGYIARNWEQVTDFGKFADPIA
ncbi:MAG: CDP-alcohol phosphatidyltransferase family protein, partial [Candidatus Bipolaricaulia bacterium]